MRVRDDFVAVTVPATSANLGPGFDCMGLALDLWDDVSVHAMTGPTSVIVEGEGAGNVEQGEDNLVVRALRFALDRVGAPQVGVRMHCTNRIPHSRGLGSSASAIVAGVALARALVGEEDVLGRQEILQIGTQMEGHPDNAAPALLGGMRASFMESGKPVVAEVPIAENVGFIAMIPNFETRTSDLRRALPESVPMQDVIFNLSRVAVLLRAMETGEMDLIGRAMQDRLHQPYRAGLIRECDRARVAALASGAAAFCISGSGSTCLAIAEAARAEQIVGKIREALAKSECEWRVLALKPDRTGAQVKNA